MNVLGCSAPIGDSFEVTTNNAGSRSVTVVPGGAANSGVPLSDVKYADHDTTVAPGDQDGFIGRPFTKIQDALALIAEHGGVVYAAPLDYSDQGEIDMYASSSLIGMQVDGFGGVIVHSIVPAGIWGLQNVVVTNGITNPHAASGVLQNCVVFGIANATAAGDITMWQGTEVGDIRALTLVTHGTSVVASNIGLDGTTAKFQNTTFGSPTTITFNGSPGTVTFDAASWDSFTALGGSIVNGTAIYPHEMFVYFSPTAGHTDGTALNALIASEYGPNGQKRTIVCTSGAYTIDVPVTVVSNMKMTCQENCTFTAALSGALVDPVSFMFGNTSFALVALTGTLASQANPGSTHLSVTDSTGISVGDKLTMSNRNAGEYSVIVRYVALTDVYLENPLQDTFPAGQAIYRVDNYPQNFSLDFNNAVLTGHLCMRYLEFAEAVRGQISNVQLDDSGGWAQGAICASWDNGSMFCTTTNARLVTRTVVATQYGFALESNFQSRLNVSTSGIARGMVSLDSCDCSFDQCNADGTEVALFLGTGGSSATKGSMNISVNGGVYGSAHGPGAGINVTACTLLQLNEVNFAGAGIVGSSLAVYSNIVGTEVVANDCQFFGLAQTALSVTGGTNTKVRVNGGTVNGQYDSSIAVYFLNTGPSGYINGLAIHGGNQTQGIFTFADIDISNVEIDGFSIPICLAHTGTINISLSRFTQSSQIASFGVIQNNAAGAMNVSGVEIACVANGNAIALAGASKNVLRDVTAKGGGTGGTGVSGFAGASIVRDVGCDFSSFTTQFDATATGETVHVTTAAGP